MHRWLIRLPCALHPAIGSLPRNSLACSAAGGAAAVSPLDSLSPVRKRASPPKAAGEQKSSIVPSVKLKKEGYRI